MVVWPRGCNCVPRRVPAQLYWPGAGALQRCAHILTRCQEFPHLMCEYNENTMPTTDYVFVKADVAPADREKRNGSVSKIYIIFITSKEWKNATKSLDQLNFKVSEAKWLREILNFCSESPDYKPATTKILNKFTQLRDFMFFFAVKNWFSFTKSRLQQRKGWCDPGLEVTVKNVISFYNILILDAFWS